MVESLLCRIEMFFFKKSNHLKAKNSYKVFSRMFEDKYFVTDVMLSIVIARNITH